jgi:hypothetical protein
MESECDPLRHSENIVLGQAWQLMTVIPATVEVKIGRIMVIVSLKKKVVSPYFSNKPGVVQTTVNPNYVGDIGRRIMVQVWPQVKS